MQQLPRDSALIRATAGDASNWSRTDYLIADLIDLIRARWWSEDAGRAKQARKAEPKKPELYPRPGDEARRAERRDKERARRDRALETKARREAELREMGFEVAEDD